MARLAIRLEAIQAVEVEVDPRYIPKFLASSKKSEPVRASFVSSEAESLAVGLTEFFRDALTEKAKYGDTVTIYLDVDDSLSERAES